MLSLRYKYGDSDSPEINQEPVLNKNILYFFIFLLSVTTPFVTPTYADEELEQYTQVRIIAERTAIRPADQITLAIDIKLAPHWHVYWQNPGDSGLPVRIEWDAPEGFEIGEIKWPTPDKISYDILVNYGYYNQAVLLQTLKTPDILPEGKITLTATINLLVCNEICIPEQSTISIDLNAPEDLDTDNSAYIQESYTKIAKPINGAFLYSEADKTLRLSLVPEDRTLLNEATTENLEFFPIDWGIINHVAMPNVQIDDGKITILHERGDQAFTDIKELNGLLVIKGEQGNNKGFAITALPEESATAPVVTINKNNIEIIEPVKNVQVKKITWFSALYLALFGGLILNLMPCVFPILSMKALSLVKMNDKENKEARTHGIAYTLGVVLSFLVIGGILLVLKEAGTVVGWGFQLQNPMIVAVLAYLLFIIGLNLIGFFEFKSNFGNIGNKLTQGQSLSSSFFTGTLATIVATPCTAPFMGAAMGYALTQPAIVSMSVFGALGFGLALPYLVLSYVPQFRRILPKPGAWMNVFKQFLSFPIFASSIWLIWVLSQQSGSYGVLLVLLGMLAIAFCVWLSHLKSKGIARRLTSILFVLFMFLPIFSLSYIKNTSDSNASAQKSYSFGMPFSPEKLSILLEGDDPIFVEMTAAWCITCKVNHAIAINTDATKTLFKENNVQYLIGDWTSHDDTITQYLQAFGRNGVPIYVFYAKRDAHSGKRPEAKLLPQIITTKTLQKTIGR